MLDQEHSTFCPTPQQPDGCQPVTMPNEEETQRVAEVFKMFGDPTRVRILTALLQQERCVFELSDLLDLSQSAVSHQLRLLRSAHLVKNRREGKLIYYSLDDDHVSTILAKGLEHVRHRED